MSIKVWMSSDGLEEMYTAPTLKELCLYKCVTNKDILTTEVEVDQATNGSRKLPWESYRLKEPIQRDLVEALLDTGDKYMFMLTPKYEPVIAAIRMSQPEHLVKVHVNNTDTLEDRQLELLLSGSSVKSLDINGCLSLRRGSLDAINKFGSKLEYLRIGNSCRILPKLEEFSENSPILRTPNLKTFIVSQMHYRPAYMTEYWICLLQDFIGNLEELQICDIEVIETLEFLEPAKTKLTSLTLSNCGVTRNAYAWASLFKLDNLRSLHLVGLSIEEALVGENVVQRLLTAIPNLTCLVVDPGLVNKDISVNIPIPGQGSLAKRLEFLGIVDNDEAVLRMANLLANNVAHFGTLEGELRIVEYLSTRDYYSGSEFCTGLERLLESLNEVPGTAPCNSVTVINLVLKTFKTSGVIDTWLLSQIWGKLLTTDVAEKLGDVLLDQCIGAIVCLLPTRWSYEKPKIISSAIDIIMNLDTKLSFEHYANAVPMIMHNARRSMTDMVVLVVSKEHFPDMLNKIAKLLEKAMDRFPEKTNELGIPLVLWVLQRFKEVTVSNIFRSKIDFMEILSSMLASVKKMCLNSGARKTAFHYPAGIQTVLQLLSDTINGYLVGFADRESITLLEILKTVVQDTDLELSDPGMIASGLEKLLLSVNTRWQLLECPSDRETTVYLQQQSIISLLNSLESDPKFDYKASDAVQEIMAKLK